MRDFHAPGRSPVLSEGGMCATSHPMAARLAVETLRRGGNAADAAVAAAVALGVCEPHMCGLGGDCFALVKPAGSEEIEALNASGRAPAGTDAGALRAEGLDRVPLHGPHAVTVPGAVAGLCELLEKTGRLGREDVLSPVADLFEAGVPVAPRVARDWAGSTDALRPGAAREVYLPSGGAPAQGARFALPGQAEILRRIARDGARGFYEGEVAEDMVATLRGLGGAHEAGDFASAACDWTRPITGDCAGVELIEHPPNGQGATAFLMAGILAEFDVAGLDPIGAERIHLQAEAARLAYDARDRFLADPDHVTALDRMTAPETARRLAALIDHRQATAGLARAAEAVHRDTVYVTVVDRDRMAVSLIYSIFHGFGSGIASDRFGILLQNRGAGFTLREGHPNEMAPGKRPMHTIIPAMTREGGRVASSFGVMGGQYQPAGHVHVLHNIRHFGMDWQSAIDAPRSFAEGDSLNVETGYSPETRQALADMGHRIVVPDGPIGGAQAIRIDPAGYLEGASDPRKDGCALGY